MRKRSIAIALVIGIISSMGINVAAGTKNQLENKLQEQKKELENSKNKLGENQKRIEEIEVEIGKIESEIEKFDCKIIELSAELEITNDKVIELSQQIKNAEEEIVTMENKITEETEAFGKRLRALYMGGNQNMLEVLLDSKSLNDFLTRAEVMKKISDYDKKLLSSMKDQKIELADKKSKLNEDKKEITKLKEEQEAQLAILESSKESQMNLIKEVEEKRENLIASIPEYEQIIQEQENLIISTLNQISSLSTKNAYKTNTSYSRGNGAFNGNDVVEYAKEFIGIPYKWGGNSPEEGMDCSGYVRYVYRYFGVYLTRTTYSQINEGVYISRNELEPGDLVFFGYGSPHHVGIYIGNNYYIHAPRTGDYIKISPMTRTDYMTGRRVI